MTLAVIVSVVVTGMVMTMALAAGMQSQQTTNLRKMDGAFFAAETGVARLAWNIKNGNVNTMSSPLTGTVNGYAYTTSWRLVGPRAYVTSRGSLGSVSYTLTETVIRPITPPATVTTSSFFDNMNLRITGDLAVDTDYDNGGNGSVSGNLTYYGTASDTGSVGGTLTKLTGIPDPIDFSALGATLIAAAGATYNGNQTGTTFNFDALSGTNKVIYVNGKVTNPVFVGSGTLYAKGNVSAGDFGTSSKPVNIVTQGDVTTSDGATIYGSIYSGGNWNRGKIGMVGNAYVAGTIQTSNNGTSNLTGVTAPWFDPRTISGGAHGSGTQVTFYDFTGPQI